MPKPAVRLTWPPFPVVVPSPSVSVDASINSPVLVSAMLPAALRVMLPALPTVKLRPSGPDLISSLIVKPPDSVLSVTLPLLVSPMLASTVPTVKAALFTKASDPTVPATVVTWLAVLCRSKAPAAPDSFRPAALMEPPVWVSVPETSWLKLTWPLVLMAALSKLLP